MCQNTYFHWSWILIATLNIWSWKPSIKPILSCLQKLISALVKAQGWKGHCFAGWYGKPSPFPNILGKGKGRSPIRCFGRKVAVARAGSSRWELSKSTFIDSCWIFMKLKLSVSNCPDSQAGTLQPIASLWVQWWCFCCTWHCVCTENPSRAWAFEERCLQGLFTLDSVQDARHDVSWQKQKDSSPTQIVLLCKHLTGWVGFWPRGWSGRPQEYLKRHGHLTPSALRERPVTASKEASRQVFWDSCVPRRFPQSSHGYLGSD